MERFMKRRVRSSIPDYRTHSALSSAKSGALASPSLTKHLKGNIDGVNTFLSLAKLSEIKGEIQQIEFDSPFFPYDFRILEVPEHVAEEIESGGKIVFRGELNDFPVLCTRSRTYQVKEAETSNTLLLLPELHTEEEIGSGERFLTTKKIVVMQSRYLELREMKVVALGRLRDLLRDTEIEWTSTEKNDGRLWTFKDLLDVVQMSEQELNDALDRLPVITVDGNVRMLSSEYRDRLLMELIDCVDDEEEPDINVSSVNVQAFREAVRSHHPQIPYLEEAVNWLMKSHCTPVDDGGEAVKYALEERAVCRSKVSQLLRASVRFEYSAFEKMLKQLLPEGINMKVEYLNGLALVENALTTGKTIRYLNIEELPEDENKRLKLLFALRSAWKPEDIRHFLTDICPTTRSLNELLSRCCRESELDGERLLVSLR